MTWQPGKWKVICDVCGFDFLNTELKERWDGLMVCEKDWEPRHPQDFIKSPKEQISVPWSTGNDLNSDGTPKLSVAPTYISTSVGTQENTNPSGTFSTNNGTL